MWDPNSEDLYKQVLTGIVNRQDKDTKPKGADWLSAITNGFNTGRKNDVGGLMSLFKNPQGYNPNVRDQNMDMIAELAKGLLGIR